MYYLEKEQYGEGIIRFEKALSEKPNDPAVNYYLGRFYLAQDKAEQAIPRLRRAADLSPNSADYHFWLGVAHWAVRDFKSERRSYLNALAANPHHSATRLYLGHNYLDQGQWLEAIEQYDKVLNTDQANPEALYNRGLGLKNLGRSDEEITALKRYLQYYPEGKWAIRAVDHLNEVGDFSYRNFTIGYRRVPLKQISFAPGSARVISECESSLQVIGGMLSINKDIRLEIVGHLKGSPSEAAARAKTVKDQLLKSFPAIDPSRIKHIGKGNGEEMKIGDRTYLLQESISISTVGK
jgi:tetratricopeptide (TPR) repeat protein